MIRTIVLVALLTCGLAASCFVVGLRGRVESADKNVEIAVDYGEIETIAASTGEPASRLLSRFKRAGATSVAISEQTVRDLIDARKMIPYGERQFALEVRLAERVRSRLQAALADGESRVTVTPLSTSGACYLTVAADIPLAYLEGISVGLPDEAVAAARSAGLHVIARLMNYPGIRIRAIVQALSDLASKRISKVIFQGEQVLGFKGGVVFTAHALKRARVIFGRVEFARQKGETELLEEAPDNVVIVHSIPQNEMPSLSAGSIVERFQRAVRERGVRVCYVRMYDTCSPNLIESNARYLARISQAIRETGFTLGECRPVEELWVRSWVRLLSAAGAAAGFLLLFFALFTLSPTASALLILGVLAGSVGLATVGYTGRNAVALIAAVAFPTLGVVIAVRNSPGSLVQSDGSTFKALGRTLSAAIVGAAGGVTVVGLMSERSYMLRSHVFMGVKAAQLLPILVLAVIFAGGIAWQADTWDQQKRRIVERFRELASSPMVVWQAALWLAVLLMLGIMLARSGNEPGVGVSEYELRFRAFLDKVLYVRPRTKEFLIGYPALLIGIAFALRGMKRASAILVVIGSIALVSEINSFCHIHTPLAVSALRAVNGAVIGCVIGLMICAFVGWRVGRHPGK